MGKVMSKGAHRKSKPLRPVGIHRKRRHFRTVSFIIASLPVAAGAVWLGNGPPQPPPINATMLAAYSSAQGYIVRPGDTLSQISLRFCGTSLDYAAIASASQIQNANMISVGEHITIRCSMTSTVTAVVRGGGDGDGDSDDNGPVIHMSQTGSGASHYSYSGLESLWIGAGGPSWAARTAACIAEAESGGNANDTGLSGERGLWQIMPSWGSLSTYSPTGNARGAVIISHGGTNWGPWTTRGRCGA